MKEFMEKLEKSKKEFHKKRASLSYEEKYKIFIELQKLDIEMAEANPDRKSDRKFKVVFPEV